MVEDGKEIEGTSTYQPLVEDVAEDGEGMAPPRVEGVAEWAKWERECGCFQWGGAEWGVGGESR